MGFIHALEPVRDAGSWTCWGGCGGIGRRAALRSLWANNPWKFESSQPHHFSFQIPRKHKGFAVKLVGGDTFCDTHGSDKRAVFDKKKRHLSPA